MVKSPFLICWANVFNNSFRSDNKKDPVLIEAPGHMAYKSAYASLL